MKKALIVLLSLAVAGGLFAQSFSGGVSSGLLLGFDEDGHSFYTSKSDGGDQYGYYFNWGWTGESGRVGGGINAAGSNGEGWNFDGSNLWFKPLDILTLKGGGGGLGGFGTPGAVDASNDAADQGVGLSLKLEPIAGLALGAGVEPKALEIGKALYTFGASYTLTNLVGVVANVRLNPETVDDDGVTTDSSVNAAAGVNVLALSNIAGLTIGVDVAAENVANLSDAGKVTAGAKIGFKVADLGATLLGKVLLPMTDAQKDIGLNALIGADLSYPIGAITANLNVGYLLNGVTDAGRKFNPGRWEAMPFDFIETDSSALSINPSISFKVSEASLNVGYGLKTNVGGDVSKLNHEIYTGVEIGF